MIEAALDTSHGMSLAVSEDGHILASEYLAPKGRQNREALTPWLKEIFDRCEVSPNRIARWTVGLGPGSFTGIRMGLAFAKGVRLQSAAQIRGIPTSCGMALQAAADLSPGATVAVVHDARRKQVIITTYRKTRRGLKESQAAHIPSQDDLRAICMDSERLVTLQPAQVTPNLPETAGGKLLELGELRAEYLLKGPGNLFRTETEGDLSSQVLPVYVRPAVFIKPNPHISKK